MSLAANATIDSNRTLNAIKINGTGLTLGGAGQAQLTLSAASVISLGGSNTISTPLVAFGANVSYFQVANGTTLAVTGILTGTGGMAKASAGTLDLQKANYKIGRAHV